MRVDRPIVEHVAYAWGFALFAFGCACMLAMLLGGCAASAPRCYDYALEMDSLTVRVERVEAKQAALDQWQHAITAGDVKIIGVDMK